MDNAIRETVRLALLTTQPDDSVSSLRNLCSECIADTTNDITAVAPGMCVVTDRVVLRS